MTPSDPTQTHVSLVVPDGCFLDANPERTLVVRACDGEPLYAVEGGELVDIKEWRAGRVKGAFTVKNPEGFNGFPDHDRSHPHYQLGTFSLNSRDYFVHWEAEHPLVVRHADGEPVFRLVDGRCEALKG
jgi:hypothetical protein